MEEKQITLQIDGHFITVPEGSTILEAAIKIGINIPTLCHIDLLYESERHVYHQPSGFLPYLCG